MRDIDDPRDIDAENFYRLVLIVRSIAVARPQNLAKFAEQHAAKPIDEASREFFFFLSFFFRINSYDSF